MTPPGTVYDCGDRALLLEFEDIAEVLAWSAAIREAELPGVLDVVPAARTVLVTLTDPGRRTTARARLGELRVTPTAIDGPSDDAAHVTIDVVYDGADLDEVARLSGLSPDEVVAAHTAVPLRVGFGGFAPGFAYLVGGDPRLNVPRRADPRTRVPVGSVGLAGEFSGVYPRESPDDRPVGVDRGPRPTRLCAHGRHQIRRRRPPLARLGQQVGGQRVRPCHRRGDVRRVRRQSPRRRRRDRGHGR